VEHPECGEGLEIEGELALARGLIDSGELTHGVRHLGFAAAMDPIHPEVLRVLDEVASDAGELAPDTVEPAAADGMWSGEAALQAWFLHRVGRAEEAVDVLLQVVAADPERRWSGPAPL
jgi:hypothetical protein